MNIKTVCDLDLENKKVFVRIDIDSENLENIKVLELKLYNSLPTIKYLVEQGAKVVIGAHIGNSENKKNSFEEVGLIFSRKLGKDIVFLDDIFSDAFKKLIVDLPGGSVILLENLSFYESELSDQPDLPDFLSNNVDFYVNEAFSLSAKSYSSLNCILDIFDNEKIAVGINFINEYENLKKIKSSEKKTFLLFLNGSEVSRKIEFANLFIEDIDKIVLIGEVANSYSKALNSDFSGNYDKNAVFIIKKLISSANARDIEIIKTASIDRQDKFKMQLNDVDYLKKIICDATNILWLGPVEGFGDLEAAFEKSKANISAIGKDALFSLHDKESKKCFNFISTSGNLALDFLKDNELSVLEKLKEL